MARKLRDNYNIDTLRLCFKQPKDFFQYIAETKPNTKIQRDGYFLYVLGDEEEEKPTSVTCNVVSDDGIELGLITFNQRASKYGELCFFRFSNKALYESISIINGEKGNLVHCIGYVMDDLGLEFVSVTELHISNDSNINKIAKFMRYKRDEENYDMIVNRRKVRDRAKIEGYKEVWQSYRKKKVNPSIYIQQKKENTPKLCIYNKSVEITEESGKEYVETWNEFGDKQTIYRSEIRLRWDSLKEYFDDLGVSGFNIIQYILISNNLKAIFEHYAVRMVYFKPKNGDENVSIHNIA